MFSQYFGNYLLNNGYLTKDQVLKVLEVEQNTHVKIGVIAVNSGKITSKQVEEIQEEQKRQDKRFGEIAIEKGYITEVELDEMLSQQKGHLVLMQAIIDQGYMALEEMEKIYSEYKNKFKIDTQTLDNAIDDIVRSHTHDNKIHFEYIKLLMRNINRFMNSVVVIGEGELSTEGGPVVGQAIVGEGQEIETQLLLSEKALEHAVLELGEGDPDIEANEVMEEFLNLQNGLFIVNQSNNNNTELELEPPYTTDVTSIKGKVYTFYSNYGSIQAIIN